MFLSVLKGLAPPENPEGGLNYRPADYESVALGRLDEIDEL